MGEPIKTTLEQHALLVILASTISFGVTEIVKPFVSALVEDRGKRRAIVRLLAILGGVLVGYTLGPSWLDVWFGAGAGVLNAWLVAVLKEKIEKRLDVHPDRMNYDKTPPPSLDRNDQEKP
jgi:biotin transporter BioY